MLFNSAIFLFAFMPLVLLLHSAVPRTFKNPVLVLASLFFYFFGEGYFVLVLLTSVALNYLCALLIASCREEHPSARRSILYFGVAGNLGILIVYKYLGFITGNLAELSRYFSGPKITVTDLVLPIGISFFTFQALSYLVDVYRGEVKAERNPLSLTLYISLFPQLIAGPIVRYSTIAEQIKRRSVSFDQFTYGALRFVQGLGKKVLLADPLAKIADTIFGLPAEELTPGLAWLGVLAYSFQIYLDFSGYSDMAIGLGRMMGFRFLENFNYPYIATSIREFWRRWHISLSTWFRDYLYIPLGGNRRGNFWTSFNLFTVFLLCGFWHGASWNFAIWGLMHGAALAIERFERIEKLLSSMGKFRIVYVTLIVLLAWVMFRAETLTSAVLFYERMFGLGEASDVFLHVADFLTVKNILIFSTACLVSYRPLLCSEKWQATFPTGTSVPIPRFTTMAAHLALLFLCFLQVAAGSYSPFIYFRF